MLYDKAKEALSHTPSLVNEVVNPVEPPAEGVSLNATHADAFLGAGWYHYDTPEDQIFMDHAGELDFYIYNLSELGVDGRMPTTGNDVIPFFEIHYGGLGDQVQDITANPVKTVTGDWHPIVNPDGTYTTSVDWYEDGHEVLLGTIVLEQYIELG